MYIYLLIQAIMCMEDYEMNTVMKMRELIVENMKQNKPRVFKIGIDGVIYFKLLWNKSSIKYKTYRVNIKHKMIQKSISICPSEFDPLSTCFVKKIVKNMKKCFRDEKILVIVNDHRSVHNGMFEIFRSQMDSELKKGLKNAVGEDIEVMTFLHLNKYSFEFSVYNDFLPDKIIFKFPMFLYYEHKDISYYYFQEIPMANSKIKNILKKLPYKYTTSRIENYVRHSIDYEIDYDPVEDVEGSIYEFFPYDLDFDSYEPLDEDVIRNIVKLNKNRLEDKDFRETGVFIKYKELYQGLTGHDIRGLVVLFYHVTQCPSLFLKILGEVDDCWRSLAFLLLGYSMAKLDNTRNCYKPVEFLNREEMKKHSEFFYITKYKDIGPLRPFLVIFYMICCKFFRSDLSDQIKRMSDDFVSRNMFDCSISHKDVLKTIYKAVDFLTILPFEQYEFFDCKVDMFVGKYEMQLTDEDTEKLKRNVRKLSIFDEFAKHNYSILSN